MPIKILQEDAERHFLIELEKDNQKKIPRGFLFCRFSNTSIATTSDNVSKILKSILSDNEAAIYHFHDGDMAISWKSDTKEIYEKVKYLIITYFSKELGGTDNNKIFSFYDTIAQAEDLRVLLRNKLLNIKKDKPYVITNKEGTKINIENYFTVKHKNALKASLLERKHRKETSILVVEDQEFSATLLMGLLRKYYKCYHAKNAKEAIDLYCEHAPNIAFLDIELPDLSGHYLAAIFNKCDPESFMVMVTANNFIKDVEVAKKNNVRGFIIKPYSKEKILSATKQYANKKV